MMQSFFSRGMPYLMGGMFLPLRGDRSAAIWVFLDKLIISYSFYIYKTTVPYGLQISY